MAYTKKAYVEHVAIRVRDIDWHIRFFRDVLGMTVKEVHGSEEAPIRAWTIGGMQFNLDQDFQRPDGLLDHIGLMVEDLEAVLREAQGWGIKEGPMGRNWLQLPEGLMLEINQAHGNAVAEALAVQPQPKP
ncbi:VOC family protein [Propionivibrio limicola]|uniref:VOC family protein n=1 Tax=Propionivibrio limicola TaxID=167645 RepID=UPI0012919489|nr:VOC family protein [Propionivibrio limicola]